jgi:hypothetical protein
VNTIVSTVAEIKKVYLNTASDLSQLITTLEDELELQGSPFDTCKLEELLFFCKLITSDIAKNNTRCALFARLHNKLDPPLHTIPKRKQVTYLRRVK